MPVLKPLIDIRHTELLQKLLFMTKQNAIKWTENKHEDHIFSFNLSNKNKAYPLFDSLSIYLISYDLEATSLEFIYGDNTYNYTPIKYKNLDDLNIINELVSEIKKYIVEENLKIKIGKQDNDDKEYNDMLYSIIESI